MGRNNYEQIQRTYKELLIMVFAVERWKTIELIRRIHSKMVVSDYLRTSSSIQYIQ